MYLLSLKEPIYADIYKKIHGAYLEQLGCQNIIMYMINNNMRNTQEYKDYFKEYIEVLGKYEIIKKEFELLIKENNPEIDFTHWEIIFEKDAVQLD